jgi:hypothetical protein
MPILNLQKLLDGDNIAEIVDKINENFNQLSINGGGPLGKRGEQGPPGLPGLRGQIGITGDNGESGQNVNIVGNDPNWGVLYTGNPSGPITGNADSAIAEGYKIGDVWIDNANGLFYVIVENTPGQYDFVPYPISPAALSVGELWSQDTESNTNNNNELQGIRNRNRYATLSLTSKYNTDNIAQPDGESSPYSNLATGWQSQNEPVWGYQRKAYKLSIDNATGEEGLNPILRVSDAFEGELNIHYGVKNNKLVPLIYLSNGSELPSISQEKSSFGFLMDSHTKSINGEPEKISILTIGSSEGEDNRDQLFVRTQKLGTSRELYFQGKDNDNAFMHLLDINSDGRRTTGNNSLWLGIASITTPSLSGEALPFSDNDHTTLFGIENRLYKDGSTPQAGKINFYTNNSGLIAGRRFVMSLDEQGGLGLGILQPASNFTNNDNTAKHRIVVRTLSDDPSSLENVAAFMSEQLSDQNAAQGAKLVIGFLPITGEPRRYKALLRSFLDDTGNIITDSPLIIQPNINVTESSIANSTGVGQINPTAKLHIGGNLKIDVVNNGQGNFLTRNSTTNEILRRTASEVLADIGGVGGTGVATRIAFWTGAKTLGNKQQLFWDNVNNRLGVGIDIPRTLAHFRGTTTDTVVTIEQSSLNALSIFKFLENNGTTELANLGIVSLPPGGNDPAELGDNRFQLKTLKPGLNIEISTNDRNNLGSDGGNIFIRPANTTNSTDPTQFTSKPGVIVMERRVQMINGNILEPGGRPLEISSANPIIPKSAESYHLFMQYGNSVPSFTDTWNGNQTTIIFPRVEWDRMIKFRIENPGFVSPAATNATIRYAIYISSGSSVPLTPPPDGAFALHQTGLYDINDLNSTFVTPRTDGDTITSIIPACHRFVVALRYSPDTNPDLVSNNVLAGFHGRFRISSHKFGKDVPFICIPTSTPI